MRPTLHRVVSRRQETADTVTLCLEPEGEYPLPAFAPGQFTMLYAFGRGEAAISISGPDVHSGGEPGALVHTIRAVGGVSRGLCDCMEGDVVGARGPFGRGWPMQQAYGRDLLIVAGGIGLAPLRPALLNALAHRSQFGRVIVLIGARTPSDIIFADEFDDWRTRGAEVWVSVDAAGPDWRGHVGVVTTLLGPAALSSTKTVAFVCGPEVMMRFVGHELGARGVPDSAIWLTMERNMKCALGICGRCQWGADFVCRQGPVFSLDAIRHRLFFEAEV